jgi:hypothetical protein
MIEEQAQGSANDASKNSPVAQKDSVFHIWKALRLLFRIAVICVVTYGFGWTLNRSARNSELSAVPPGFGRGVLHGALMPGAMPSLFFGKDVVIYAEKNNGRLYKLGYTFGVNGCGLLFFGMFYYRLNRLRKLYGANR